MERVLSSNQERHKLHWLECGISEHYHPTKSFISFIGWNVALASIIMQPGGRTWLGCRFKQNKVRPLSQPKPSVAESRIFDCPANVRSSARHADRSIQSPDAVENQRQLAKVPNGPIVNQERHKLHWLECGISGKKRLATHIVQNIPMHKCEHGTSRPHGK
jgi:hypothetical protein